MYKKENIYFIDINSNKSYSIFYVTIICTIVSLCSNLVLSFVNIL